jgi:diacylglycerol kinase family enzyme
MLSPQIVSVDSGKINDHHFFNVAGFGLDANICQHFEEFGIRGPIPYFLVGTRAFLAFHPDPVQIHLDDRELEFSPLLVSIANAPEYGNGAVIAPSALPDDGFLDVAVLDPMPLWRAVPNLYRLFNGTIDKLPGFHSFRVKKVEIERLNSGAIHTDGNPHQEKSQLKIEVIPNSLNVVAGPGFLPAPKSNLPEKDKKS